MMKSASSVAENASNQESVHKVTVDTEQMVKEVEDTTNTVHMTTKKAEITTETGFPG